MLRTSILCFFLASPLAHAQSGIECMSADDLDAALVDWHGETVISESEDGRFAFWQNVNSGSWTVVEYLRTGDACVLGQGTDWPAQPADALRYTNLNM